MTVPAYQWLWSGHDEVNHHHRRYNRATLQQAAQEAGWECTSTTHFNSLLLPVAITLRALDRLHARATESSLDLWVPPAPLNWLLRQPLNLPGRHDRAWGPHPRGPLTARGASLIRSCSPIHRRGCSTAPRSRCSAPIE